MADPINKERLLIESYTGPIRVDRENGMLLDVLLLGTKSRNGYNYLQEARRDAVALFENCMINLAHQEGERSLKALAKPTEFHRRVGKAVNAHDTADGVRGNVKLLKKHPWYEVLMESAEDNPDLFGFSPVMQGSLDSQGNVSKISRVKCVDVVADPATTRGLFEEEGSATEGDGSEEPSAEQHYAEACKKACLDVVTEVLDKKLTPEEAVKKIKEYLKAHLKMHGNATDAETPDTTPADTEMKEELQTLRLEKECRLLIEEAGLPADKELLETLTDIATTESRKKHIAAVKRTAVVKKPKSGALLGNAEVEKKDFALMLRGK